MSAEFWLAMGPEYTALVRSQMVWAEALADPVFVASMEQGLADIAAGRLVPLRDNSDEANEVDE